MAVRFSFIVPTRNEASYIAGCLRSIRKQRRKDYEIIVVDTLSSDGTTKIAKRYADKVLKEKRRGPAIARNTGAHAARGYIFVFADADVRFERDFLDKLDAKFIKHPAVVGGIFNLHTYDAKSAVHARSYDAVSVLVRFLSAIGTAMTIGSCFAYRRDVFRKVNGFNPSLFTNEDHDIAQRISKLGRFVYFKNIDVYTSVRRVAKIGLLRAVATYIKSTAIFILNKGCIRNYW